MYTSEILMSAPIDDDKPSNIPKHKIRSTFSKQIPSNFSAAYAHPERMSFSESCKIIGIVPLYSIYQSTL